MTDLLLGLASPEFWRNCGSALVALGVIGVAGVIFLSDAKRGMQKGECTAKRGWKKNGGKPKRAVSEG